MKSLLLTRTILLLVIVTSCHSNNRTGSLSQTELYVEVQNEANEFFEEGGYSGQYDEIGDDGIAENHSTVGPSKSDQTYLRFYEFRNSGTKDDYRIPSLMRWTTKQHAANTDIVWWVERFVVAVSGSPKWGIRLRAMKAAANGRFTEQSSFIALDAQDSDQVFPTSLDLRPSYEDLDTIVLDLEDNLHDEEISIKIHYRNGKLFKPEPPADQYMTPDTPEPTDMETDLAFEYNSVYDFSGLTYRSALALGEGKRFPLTIDDDRSSFPKHHELRVLKIDERNDKTRWALRYGTNSMDGSKTRKVTSKSGLVRAVERDYTLWLLYLDREGNELDSTMIFQHSITTNTNGNQVHRGAPAIRILLGTDVPGQYWLTFSWNDPRSIDEERLTVRADANGFSK